MVANAPLKQWGITTSIVFGLLKGIGGALVGMAYQAGVNVLNWVVDAILFVPRTIGDMVMGLIGGIVGAVKGMIWVAQNPKQAIEESLKWLGNTITGAFVNLIKWIGRKTLSVMTFGLSETNIGKAIGGAVVGDATNKAKQVGLSPAAAFNPFGFIGSWAAGLFGGNKAGGWMPPGSPLAREMASMPSGATPVVANSSEAILNQGQQSALAGLLRGNRGGGTFAPVITVQGNADRGDIDYLVGELDRMYRQYSAGFA
jgi:hypothetical protein